MREKSKNLQRRILLVDDDKALRQSLAEQLRLHEEFDIGEAGSGSGLPPLFVPVAMLVLAR